MRLLNWNCSLCPGLFSSAAFSLLVCLTLATVITDHHPLVSILNHHRLDEIENPRLQRLKM